MRKPSRRVQRPPSPRVESVEGTTYLTEERINRVRRILTRSLIRTRIRMALEVMWR